MRSEKIKIIMPFILCLLGVAIYSNTFHGSFHFDDNLCIVTDSNIKNLGNVRAIWDEWPTRFVTFLTLAFNYRFSQLNVFGYHLFNVIVHLVSALLVFWLTLLTFSTPFMKNRENSSSAYQVAFFTGLIFVAHPIQTQAVTYISQRATSLAALFYLASLGLYVKFRLEAPAGIRRAYGFGSLITAVIAMFTKESAITLPMAILLYEFCFFKTENNLNWKQLSPFLATFFVIPLTMFFTKSVNFMQMRRASESMPLISPWHYLLTQFRVIVTYLRLLFLPINQNLDYNYSISKTLFDVPTLISVFILLLVFLIAIRVFSKHRLVSFAIFWFFLTLLPESSIIPISDIIFEHRLYLPMVGYSLFVAGMFYALAGKEKRKPARVLLIIIIASYSVLAYARNFVWKDEATLWNDVIRNSPRKARPYNNLGTAYANKNKFDEAIPYFTRAIEFDPDYLDAYSNRALANLYKGSFDLAILDYDHLIRINPEYPNALLYRGLAYFKKGNLDQAISDFTQAARTNPGNISDAYSNLGVIYARKGRLDEAISDFSRAIQSNSNYANAYNGRANAYFLKQEYDKSWLDVHKAESLGFNIDHNFTEKLKKASGRER